jgi:hypothetical protein
MACDLSPLYHSFSCLLCSLLVRADRHAYADHTFFFEGMKAGGGGEPAGKVGDAIKASFGSYDEFAKQFKTAGATQFGSGWAWLVTDKGGMLSISKSPNAETPLVAPDEVLFTLCLMQCLFPPLPFPAMLLLTPAFMSADSNLGNGRVGARVSRSTPLQWNTVVCTATAACVTRFSVAFAQQRLHACVACIVLHSATSLDLRLELLWFSARAASHVCVWADAVTMWTT